MLADLELLVIAVFYAADHLLPPNRGNSNVGVDARKERCGSALEQLVGQLAEPPLDEVFESGSSTWA